MHARLAAERVHAQAGVVGERRQAAARLAWRALASAFSRNVACGSSASAMPSSAAAPPRSKRRAACSRDLPQLAGIARREDQRARVTARRAGASGAAISCEATDAALREVEQRVELGARERLALGGALHLDEAARAPVMTTFMSQLARRVLGVVEVEDRRAALHADRDRGDEVPDRRLGEQQALPSQPRPGARRRAARRSRR